MTDVDDEKRAVRLLSLEEVLKLVPLGKRSLLRMERQGLFPPSYYLTPNRRAWKESEVVAWESSLGTQRFFKKRRTRCQEMPADAKPKKRR